jgi:hypothetical protein
MARVTDEQILEFAAANECTEVVITRPKGLSSNNPHVKFICACEKPGGKQWVRFEKSPMCAQCSIESNPKVTDEMIIAKLNTGNCEFVSRERRTVNGRKRIFVKFICACDKETTRTIRELQWDCLMRNVHCSDCGHVQRSKSIKKVYAENGVEIRERIKNTMLEKYGVEHQMHCAEIMERAQKNSFLNKKYTFPSEREIMCQGYEPLALDLLLKQGVDENDILTDNEIGKSVAFPKFMYQFGGSTRRYYPDIYVASEDKFIEVKSDYTLSAEREQSFLKAEAVKKYGYDIEIWVFNGRKALIDVIKF